MGRMMLSVVLFMLFLPGVSVASSIHEITLIEETISWDQLAKVNKSFDLLPFRSVEEFKKELISWNKHIKTEAPNRGDRIYLTPPYSPFLSWKYAPPLNKGSFFSQKFNLIAFYSTSFSKSHEKLNNGREVDYMLNSPVTLGVLFRRILNTKNSISSSAYFSYSTSSKVKGIEVSSTHVPIELGMTLFHEFAIKQVDGLNFYYGSDIERFATINENALVENRLSFDTNNIVYATIGTSIYLKKLLLKLSASHSVYSTNSNGTHSKYTGNKGILYIGVKLKNKITCSSFAKYHNLTKKNESMNMLRMGLGLGYHFF